MKYHITAATFALVTGKEFTWQQDKNQCRTAQTQESWTGLQFQGVVQTLDKCKALCLERGDECNAVEYYSNKHECSLGIAPAWNGIDIGATDVGCYLLEPVLSEDFIWQQDENQCRVAGNSESWTGLQFQGVVQTLNKCKSLCLDRGDECNAVEYYSNKQECSLGIAPAWKGIDIGATDVGCYLVEPLWQQDKNQCRVAGDSESWTGLQFQGVIESLDNCKALCMERGDECNAVEYYSNKNECSLGIAPAWKGIDIGATDVGCYLLSSQARNAVDEPSVVGITKAFSLASLWEDDVICCMAMTHSCLKCQGWTDQMINKYFAENPSQEELTMLI